MSDDVGSLSELLKEGANIDAHARDERHSTALHLAAEENQIHAVQALLDGKATVDSIDKLGQTPLMRAVYEKLPAIINALLSSRADVNKRDKQGRTALMIASKEGYATIV